MHGSCVAMNGTSVEPLLPPSCTDLQVGVCGIRSIRALRYPREARRAGCWGSDTKHILRSSRSYLLVLVGANTSVRPPTTHVSPLRAARST